MNFCNTHIEKMCQFKSRDANWGRDPHFEKLCYIYIVYINIYGAYERARTQSQRQRKYPKTFRQESRTGIEYP